MSSRRIRQRRHGFDIWPGFVDALTSLIMVLLFMMLIFAIGQFVLSDTLAGRDRTLSALNAQVRTLSRSLATEEEQRRSLDARLAELARMLGLVEAERERFRADLGEQSARAAALSNDVLALDAIKQRLEAEVAQLMTKLNVTAEDLQSKDAKIANLDKQLKLALAARVSELEKYRSEFFGKLREALEKRDDIKVVGDRFVLPSDVLFASGSAELGAEAQARLNQLVQTIREVSQKIPEQIEWVLRIDGHTDRVPIATDRFPSNWELSTARAVAIVKYLVSQGIPARHLSANGFGQYQPVDGADTPEAYAKNRRIELQLTNR